MQEREKIHAEMKARLSETRKTIDELKVRMEEQPSGDGRSGAPSLEELHARQTAAEKKLEKLSKNDQENWHKHKGDLDRFLEDIDDELRNALAYYH